jgi:acyl-CoA synthetase (NDP forming)
VSATTPLEVIGENTDALHKLLFPRSIAILGASNNPTKLSGRPLSYLKRFGYAGRIVPINLNRTEVQGLRAYRSLDEVDGELDLAMIMLPADQAADAVRMCGQRGIAAAIVSASGFAELGPEGEALQRALRAAIDESGVRVLGPNCLGLISVRDQATPTFSTALDDDGSLEKGPVAFVSQSGAFGGFVFNEAQRLGIGFSHFISTGNEVDISTTELIDKLLELDETRVVLAYLEGLSDGRRLLDAARHAHERGKPIIAVKVGRSAAGAVAAQSHTASLAGEDVVFDAAARQLGIVRVDGPEAMLDAAQIFAAGRRARGRRLTTLSVSGGAGALMADAAASSGIDVLPWDDSWQARMAKVLPSYASARNPIDITGTLVAEPDLLREALTIAVRHPETDMVAVLLGLADGVAPQLIDAIEAAHQATDIPLVVVWVGGNGKARQRLRELGIPCYTDPLRAAGALGALADFSLRTAVPVPRRPGDVNRATARDVLARAREVGKLQLDEYESTQLIAAYGVPCAPAIPARTADDAVLAAERLGPAVALKLLSNEIGHKTEVGGVRLGLADARSIHAAADDLLRRARELELDTPQVLVQQMARGEVELIIGVKRDVTFGPVVVVGLGGVLVETLADTQAAVAPVDAETARGMLMSLRGSRLLRGVRDRPPVDIDAAADIISRVSWLAFDFADDVAELDINPVLVGTQGDGAVAVDALALVADPSRDAAQGMVAAARAD